MARGGSSDPQFMCASLAQHGEKVSKVGSWKNNVYVMPAQGAASDAKEKLFAWLQQRGLN